MKKTQNLIASLMIVLLLGPVLAQDTETPPMEKVTGIGGFFFKAEDPKALAEWYEAHLGVNPVPKTYEQQAWTQEAGATVFAPFSAKTDYFGSEKQMWMINFRVRDLNAMVAQLRAQGIKVEQDPKKYPNGYFARLNDPEGNPIQLWQPLEPKTKGD